MNGAFFYEIEISSFCSVVKRRHQHTCTYFCWHYVKWWIISRHEGYIFYSLLSEKDIRGRASMKLDFLLRFASPCSIATDKRFFSTKETFFAAAPMIWLNGRVFLFCESTNIRTRIKEHVGGGKDKSRQSFSLAMCSTFFRSDCKRLIRKKHIHWLHWDCFRFDLMFVDQEKNRRYLSCICNLDTFSLSWKCFFSGKIIAS